MMRCVLLSLLWVSALAAQCTFTMQPPQVNVAAGGGSAPVTVSAAIGCKWNAFSNAKWITIASGAAGATTGTLNLRVDPNPGSATRLGTLFVSGTVLTVSQAGAGCSYGLNPTTVDVSAQGGSATVAVQSGCGWTSSPLVSWISVTSNPSGSGNGTVTYAVAANNTTASRSGDLQIGQSALRVNQAAAACVVGFSPAFARAAAAGGAGRLQVSAACPWTAASGTSWLTLSGATTGSTAGSVNYTAGPNTSRFPRTGFIAVNGVPFRVTQDGATCATAINPTSATFTARADRGQFAVAASCAWTAVSSQLWIRVVSGGSGTSGGTVAYTVDANPTLVERRGIIAVGTQAFAITQAGGGCVTGLSAASQPGMPALGGSGAIQVSAPGGCSWQATTDPWIALNPSSGTGDTVITYTVAENTTGADRAGSVRVEGRAAAITQAAYKPRFTLDGVLNGATLTQSGIAPGMMVTINGTDLGPADTAVTGARVLFDGAPGMLVSAQATRISAIAPYTISGVTNITVEYGGSVSDPLEVPVVATSPGIFTKDGSGIGPVRTLPDTGVTAGSAVTIFITGLGVIDKPYKVDDVATGDAGHPVAGFALELAGNPVEVTYAGTTQGAPAGLLQMDLKVPADLMPGQYPIVLRTAEGPSPNTALLVVE